MLAVFLFTTGTLWGYCGLVIEMSFETASEDTSWSHGVQAQFDSIVSGRMGSETNGRQASLAANSEISLLANGGVFVDADD